MPDETSTETSTEKVVKNYAYGESQDDIIVADPPAQEASTQTPEPEPQKPAATTEEPKPPVEPAKGTEKPGSTPEPVTDWKDSVKKQDKYAVLKELGYDDFTIGMLKYKESKGDFTPYLEAKSVDYSKMTPEQLFMQDLKKSNPGLSDRALQFKLKNLLSEKYFLDRDVYSEDSDEAEVGQELLQADAEALRKKFVEEQKNFVAPEPQKPEQPQDNSKEILAAINADTATTAMLKDGQVTFGEGEESFHFPVDAKQLTERAAQTFATAAVKDLGKVNLSNFYKALAISMNMENFQKQIAEHYINVGKKMSQTALQNVTPPEGTPPTPEPDLTPAQQLAKSGRIV